MNSLRWILAAAGALLVIGIYIWGRIRRPAAREYASLHRDASGDFSFDAKSDPRSELPELKESISINAPISRKRAATPPIISAIDAHVDIDELPSMRAQPDVDIKEAVHKPRADSGSLGRREPSIDLDQSARLVSADSMSTGAFIASQAQPREPIVATDTQQLHALQRATSASTAHSSEESLLTSSALEAPATSTTPAKTAADLARPIKRNTASRKIVALRLSMGSSRIEGAKLKSLLEEANLRHGKYNIYHRVRDDGATSFSVASMVEPGTFDPNNMAGQLFPGVTLFTQLPGSQPGVELFEQLLACARQLEQGVGGILQDERGLPLTEQRAQRLREDIADFEHLLGS